MTCDDFEELSGAYAIGALPADEERNADEHLANCDKHGDVRELQAVAASLGGAALEMDPPATLKTRLMEAINADLAPSKAADRFEPRRGFLSAIMDWLRQPQTGYSLAGALGVVAIALLVWNFSLQSDDGNSSGQLVADLSGAGSGSFTYLEDQDLAVMRIDGLEPLSQGQTYQAWVITDEQPASLGLLQADADGQSVAVIPNRRFTDEDTIAVTIEPAGGSLQPTSDPIITGEL